MSRQVAAERGNMKLAACQPLGTPIENPLPEGCLITLLACRKCGPQPHSLPSQARIVAGNKEASYWQYKQQNALLVTSANSSRCDPESKGKFLSLLHKRDFCGIKWSSCRYTFEGQFGNHVVGLQAQCFPPQISTGD